MRGAEFEMAIENKDRVRFIDPVQGDMMLGAFRAACAIKGANVLIHAPVGCHWGVNFIERLSSIKTNATISALRERSVVFGGEDSLRKTIEIILKHRKNRYLILLAGSVPSIVGEDWQGVIDSVGFDLNSIAIDCGGFLGNMAEGYDACLAALCAWMDAPEPAEKQGRAAVNLIGLQGDMPRGEADILELKRLLGLVKIRVNSVFPPSTLGELKRAPRADLNVVMGYGRALAGKMKEKWGIPWMRCTEYPYGLYGTREFIRGIGSELGVGNLHQGRPFQREEEKLLKALRPAQIYLPALYGAPAAISADLPQAKGLARFLAAEVGMDIKGIHVTSSPVPIDETKGLRDVCPNVLFQTSWDRFECLINESDVALILGSDLERHLARKRDIPLILISYPSTSRLMLTSLPYMGFRGVPALVEDLVNASLQ